MLRTWIVDVVQGTPEWHAHRDNPLNHSASELAWAMGIDPHGRKRADLIRQRATGIKPEFSDYVQAKIIDPGHSIEAAARPIIEARIGDALFPITVAGEIDGLLLSASLDGAKADDSATFECKRRNNELWESVSKGIVPEGYCPQLEQGLMLLPDAEYCIFTVSDGTDVGTISCEYRSDPELRAKIVPTWRKLDEDVADYVHVETQDAPVAEELPSLPTLFIQVEGRVVASNLDVYRRHAEDFIARLPEPEKLQTDQDFANAKLAVTTCKDAADALKAQKANAQAQASSIDELFRTIDDIVAMLDRRRIDLDKRVESESRKRKEQVLQSYKQNFADYLADINIRLGGVWMPMPSAKEFDPAEPVTRSLRTLESFHDRLGAWLVTQKIKADAMAVGIEMNKKALINPVKGEKDWNFLVPDFATVCRKAPDDFQAMLTLRIQQHNDAIAAAKKKAEDDAKAKIAEEEAARVAALNTSTNGEPAMPAGAGPEHAQPVTLGAVLEAAAHNAVAAALSDAPAVPTKQVENDAVIDHQQDIAEFIKAHDFKDETRIRAILVEFVKFMVVRALKRKSV